MLTVRSDHAAPVRPWDARCLASKSFVPLPPTVVGTSSWLAYSFHLTATAQLTDLPSVMRQEAC